MTWYCPNPYSEELGAATEVLSEYLQIKMIDEIRVKLGIYAIGAGVKADLVPHGELSMSVSFLCDPQRVQELSKAVIEVLTQSAANIDRDAFEKAVMALQENWKIKTQDNEDIAGSYAGLALRKTLLSRFDRKAWAYNAVAPADLQKILEQLLPNGPAQFVLLPEK
jgi:zinc protease